MKSFCCSILILFSGLSGCAHSNMRGTVVMKQSDRIAHVCLGNDEVKIGDRVTFSHGSCQGGGGGDGLVACFSKDLGKGTVVGLMNEHYSTVKSDEGVFFAEGAIVEKD